MKIAYPIVATTHSQFTSVSQKSAVTQQIACKIFLRTVSAQVFL